MALVDTGPLTVAVERSLFGPQGRRWIERKLPEIASQMVFIGVSGFGACLLMYQIFSDYQLEGLLALRQLPKHAANAVLLHMVARLLRWHINRMLAKSFFSEHSMGMASKTPFETQSSRRFQWPWQVDAGGISMARLRPEQANKGRTDSSGSGGGAADWPVANGSLPGRGGGSSRSLSRPRGSDAGVLSLSPDHHKDGELDGKSSFRVEVTANINPSRELPPSPADPSAAGNTSISPPKAAAEGCVNEGSMMRVRSRRADRGRRGDSWDDVQVSNDPTSTSPTTLKRHQRRGSSMSFILDEDWDELLQGHTFFIKMVDDDSWVYVEDELLETDSMWGWVQNIFQRGYKAGVRYPGQVSLNDAQRLLFQCERGKREGYVRIRSRGTNTFLVFLGVSKPLTLVAWDKDVIGGDWEDLKIIWLSNVGSISGLSEMGRVVLYSRGAKGFVQWMGTRFIHTASKESATRFMLQRVSP